MSFTALFAYAASGDESAGEYYKIAVGDVLKIQVYQEDDLSGDFEVKEDGTITYPLIGTLKVANLTKPEVERMLTDSLAKDYLVNPFVHVAVRTYHQRNIIILGCVTKPGAYSFPQDKGMTLMQAISLAGGFTGYASIGGTKIVRTSRDGKKATIEPRVNDIMGGRKKDVELAPDDLIMVPERIF